MQRIACPERDDWRATAESAGFDFHTIDGERYWDERAYYAFTLEEIERSDRGADRRDRRDVPRTGRPRDRRRKISAPAENTGSLLAADLRKLAPRRSQPLWPARSQFRRAAARRRLLEYNADTPTSIFEAAVFQWTWLEQAIERSIIPKRADQFNSIHERLIEAWKKLGAGTSSASRRHDRECRGCRHAGLSRGHREPGRACDHADRYRGDRLARRRPLRRSRRPPIELAVQALSLGMDVSRRVRRAACESADALDRAALEGDPVQQGHPAAAVGDVSEPSEPAAGLFRGRSERRKLGTSFVRKPLYSREGANVALVSAGTTLVDRRGPMAPKALFARPWRRCRIFPANIPCSEAGWSITRRAACRSARTRIRSPATRRGSCRTRSCEDFARLLQLAEASQLAHPPRGEGEGSTLPRRPPLSARAAWRRRGRPAPCWDDKGRADPDRA